MEPGFQPGQQAGLGAAQVYTRHADLRESQLPRPGLYLRQQAGAVELRAMLSAMSCHPPIVEIAMENMVWIDELATQVFAAQLAARPAIANAFIALHGNLGAGKTTLVRHLLQALGVQGRVKSPTYAVVESYELPRMTAWHFDFYRFGDPREWEDAGFRDIFASPGLKLVEWPEKAAALLPVADLDIHISPQPGAADTGTRLVSLTAHTATGKALLQSGALQGAAL